MPPYQPLGALPEGQTLIEASAGTGKTYTITTLFVRLIVETDLTVDRILVVTFTEAAASELSDRIRGRLREALRAFEGDATGDEVLAALVDVHPDRKAAQQRLRLALYAFDEAPIHTIHGFCHRVLSENAFESLAPFETEVTTDARPILDEIVSDYWVSETHNRSPFWMGLLQQGGWKHGALGAMVQQATRRPEMRILPASVEPGGPLDPGHLERKLMDFSRVWRVAGRQVIDQLIAHGGMNRGTYKPERMRAWVAEIDAYIDSDQAVVSSPPSCLKWLTPIGLKERTNKGHKTPEHLLFGVAAALYDARAEAVELAKTHALALRRRLVEYARSELSARKERCGVWTYDDLLFGVERVLSGTRGGELAAAMRARYQAVLIDEFQDTDPVQYRIFSAAFGARARGDVGARSKTRLWLVGDPKQAIYFFRGADVFTYLDAAEDARAARFTLSTNWRSDPSYLEALNQLFGAAPGAFQMEGIAYHSVGAAPGAVDSLTEEGLPAPPLRLLYHLAEEEKPFSKTTAEAVVSGAVAADISRLLQGPVRIDGSAITPADVAVLTRTNAQAAALQEALRRLGVPSVQHGTASVFDSDEARELRHIVQAIAEPTHSSAVRTALATRLMGRDADDLAALETDEAAWEQVVGRFREWRLRWRERGFIHAFRHFMEVEGVAEHLLSLRGGDRRMTNLLHLGELMHRAAIEERLGIAGLLRWLARQGGEEVDEDARQLRLESDARAVQVVTAHKAKGLEYAYVYCPFLWIDAGMHRQDRPHPTFHDPERDNAVTMDIGSEELPRHLDRADAETFAEEMRLAYVALTRAKHGCTVIWAHTTTCHLSTLGYLLFPPALGGAAATRRQAAAAAIKAMSGPAMARRLHEMADRSGAVIAAEPLRLATGPEYFARELDPEVLIARTPGRKLYRAWRIASFTALTAGAPDAGPAAEGHDLDGTAPEPELGAERDIEAEIPLASFPGGTRSGTFFHSLLEHLDFERATEAEYTSDLIRRKALAFGVDHERWSDAVSTAVHALTSVALDGSGLRLDRVSRAKRLDELAFLFPVARQPGLLTPRRLAAVFRSHPGPATPPAFAERLSKLGFSPLEGFLKGFIDLVFEHAGRWYLVDYKSNWLGHRFADYAPERLQAAMLEGDYLLQYHLYTVALHRFLRSRLGGYEYERSFGGVYYLFLRGLSSDLGSRCGVFFDRPPEALIEALSAALDDPRAGVP